jgi:hypothetical protein
VPSAFQGTVFFTDTDAKDERVLHDEHDGHDISSTLRGNGENFESNDDVIRKPASPLLL